ncbi:MAG: hypothetical protein HYX41_01620 [Bdellovibrio sp.]|nr:hypothetical protein [Bdellovibrio sp.]
MALDSDVALLGTGVAPLIAANHLLSQGKSVLLLNPDLDFFLEDSELSLDPLLHGKITLDRIQKSTPQKALATLRPDFPGPLEFWTSHMQKKKQGFHDPTAPHLRERDRLWIMPDQGSQDLSWSELENLYVEAEDSGLNPQILDGFSATRKFPGSTSSQPGFRGLLIPKLCDLDIMRYRIGLMEFIRERLGPKNVVCAVNQLDWLPGGIRFRAGKTVTTAQLGLGLLVFWTPRLTSWIFGQSRSFEVRPPSPLGIRLWEEWSLISRDPPNPQVIGNFSDLTVWADYEGPPSVDPNRTSRLSALRLGPLVTKLAQHPTDNQSNWASSESFYSLARLTQDFLNWNHTTIRGMKAKAIFEWKDETPWTMCKTHPRIEIVRGCDGPLVDVVRTAKASCDRILTEDNELLN